MTRDAAVATSTAATAAIAQRACGRLTASAKAMGVEGIETRGPAPASPLVEDPVGTQQVYLERRSARLQINRGDRLGQSIVKLS